ncbi:MAG: hypothetical protein C0484_02585 [Rhodospirillum sp.]|nr:hypothetical protein [Rhodospirillum sp.]
MGGDAAWHLPSTIAGFAHHSDLNRADRDYCRSLVESGELIAALRNTEDARPEISSTIDVLIEQSQQYRKSSAFADMIDFMGRFRDYAPYNNMLVRVQNPTCSFYATASDWHARFNRHLREDARPMLILAPMHPVMLVYDLDSTDGNKVPEELLKFGMFSGSFRKDWLDQVLANAAKYRIKIAFKTLSSTHGGFATTRVADEWKMRIAVHDALDDASRFGILCHELAHIMLGHLGSDWDRWWPARANLDEKAMEVEAEATAFIVTHRFGLEGSSAAYVSRYLVDGQTIPEGVSLDLIAKTASLLERMAREAVPTPKPRPYPQRSPK